MIITNEPGYYKEGSYGIRIENMLHVHAAANLPDFLAFENLTMVPYCKELIDESLLTPKHRAEIAGYYTKVLT